ncbi:head maturation protease, ClpP-related [uncultured Azohydromonas sp.]|jgi:Protease subunit of ATP-dependent Clp proteases|uniref:head maturation protease, ClpP-related n=1 Tax=uncultured Azohydromonas sp. TaxID=487342 RepID=UPI00262618B5|nr:head maturation protease, ClpP-related [uncultured Azohydromonas sp.]
MRQLLLLRLLAENRRAFKPIEQRIVRTADASDATVYVYDPIVGDRATAEYWGGVCPQDFVPALAALDVETIHLRVNTPGGDVFAAQAMSQAMREHKARIVGHIDGLSASAGTDLCCACDEVRISPGGMYMIHQAWTFAAGNADDLEGVVGLLRKVDGTIVDTYERFTGGDRKQIEDWVKAETWFTAQEAVDAGFVHAIDAGDKGGDTAAKASAWNLSAYAKAPRMQTSAPPPPEPPAASADHRARQAQRMRLQALTIPR